MAKLSLGFIVKFKSLKIQSFFLFGYRNQTFLNSILPLISFLFIGIAFGSSSIAFIYVSSSISLKTFYAEAKDLLISGPN